MPAQSDKAETRVTQTADDAMGVEPPKATADMSGKEMKAKLDHEPDRELHPAGDVKDSGDLENPPIRTSRPDVPVLRSLATGPGAHFPPDPDKFTPEGRPRL